MQSTVGRQGKRRDRLSLRLMLGQVGLVVVPASLIGIAVVYSSDQALQATVLEGREEAARRSAQEIGHLLAQSVARLSSLALTMSVERDDWRRQSLLSQLRMAMPEAREICLVDLEGQVVVRVYLYGLRMGDGQQVETRKMVLMR